VTSSKTDTDTLNWERAQCGPPRVKYDWYPIESAPFDEDIAVQVTDGRGAPYAIQWPCPAHGDRLDQFEEGNAARGHAGELEAIPQARRALNEDHARFRSPWHANKIPGGSTIGYCRRERFPPGEVRCAKSLSSLLLSSRRWRPRCCPLLRSHRTTILV